MVTQEIKPAESLGQLLLFHLNSKSALQRISVALVICEWAALQKVRFCPQNNEEKLNQFPLADEDYFHCILQTEK